MQDLLLWQQLRDGNPSTEALRALAELPPAERLVFFALLPQALEHADAAVRAAAALALRGAAGVPAFRALVRALDDPDAQARLAAVEALRGSAAADPARWAHAVFHAHADVRRAACTGLAVPGAEWFAFYLLADPESAAEATAQLGDRRLPSLLLTAIFDHLRAGILTPIRARTLILPMPWGDVFREISRGRVRSAEQVSDIIIAAGRGHDIAPDGLDELFDLFWNADPPETAEQFFGSAGRGLLAQPKDEVRRVLAALLVTGARRGRWVQPAADLCAGLQPEFLGFSWVARETRRQAVRYFYQLGERCPRRPGAFVRRLVECDICERASGSLDLYVIGGLLHLLRSEPYKRLLEWVALERVVTSFLEDIPYALPFLCLEDKSDQGRGFLVDAITRRQPPGTVSLLAFLVHAGSADQLDFLDALDGPRAVQLFAELLTLAEQQPEPRLSDSKLRRLAETLAARIGAAALHEFLAAWLAVPAPQESALGLRVLGVLINNLDGQTYVDAALRLDLANLRKLLTATTWAAGFSYSKEVQLALALAEHADAEVRAWAAARIPVGPTTALPPDLPKEARLTPPETRAILAATEAELPKAMRSCLAHPRTGLCEVLAQRPKPTRPCVSVCAALIGAHDPLEQLAEQLGRFGVETLGFTAGLEDKVVRTWLPEHNLPLQGHAWLYRWEQHGFAFAELVLQWPGGHVAALRFLGGLAAPVLRRRAWDAWALTLGRWRWTEKARVAKLCDEAFAALLLEVLQTPEGEVAAEILVLMRDAALNPPLLERLRLQVIHLLPLLAPPVVKALTWWIDARGLSLAPAIASAAVIAVAPEEIRRCSDLDQLTAWCALADRARALEAAERLIELREPGVRRLARLLRSAPPVAAAGAIAETVLRWPKGAALRAVRDLVQDTAAVPDVRFRAGVALMERGDRQLLPDVLDAVCREATSAWFRPEDWERLRTFGDVKDIALRFAVSPQPAAYTPAVEFLTAQEKHDEASSAALRAFLWAETPRLHELRLKAARWLQRGRDLTGFPLLLQAAFVQPCDTSLLHSAPADLVDLTISAALTAGERLAPEADLVRIIACHDGPAEVREQAFARLLVEATNPVALERVLARIKPSTSRARKLRAVAETFVWGVRTGRELTGELFTVEMLAGDDLGYTRLVQNKVFINALPLLRGEEDGRAVVEALILHELGHHIYHKSDDALATWKQSEKEHLQPLLNLVSDEHLERNLRARTRDFGNRLKQLNAYAFQHATREIAVPRLLDGLGGRAAMALIATRLGVARRKGCVAVASGVVLREMEKAGLSFPRFMRALRMGLGNRHADPKVAEALELFKGNFRRSTMPQMLEMARRLREIFGAEVELLRSLGQDGVCGTDPGEVLRIGEGMTNEEVQEAIRRLLETGKHDREAPPAQVLNVSPDERFGLIPTVVRVPADRREHARYAMLVARPARQMRRFLQRLGMHMEPQRFRLRGKRIDRTRLRAAVLRGDPRLLIARALKLRTDLFLGVVIDCSGSMQMNERIEKAKRFGTMLAEAARGFPGIDLRLFGFTDSVIYDAGDADRCAVHALKAGGGNNDAAALWHAAQVARASRRRAKLLVMISDGLPTECSVAALRALVSRLTNRFKFCCAQVAVQPLEEVMFPHYVVLEEADLDTSVQRFGTIVARLVQRALGC